MCLDLDKTKYVNIGKIVEMPIRTKNTYQFGYQWYGLSTWSYIWHTVDITIERIIARMSTATSSWIICTASILHETTHQFQERKYNNTPQHPEQRRKKNKEKKIGIEKTTNYNTKSNEMIANRNRQANRNEMLFRLQRIYNIFSVSVFF